jgi:hypothetical protein
MAVLWTVLHGGIWGSDSMAQEEDEEGSKDLWIAI